jgi:Zn-dependent protease/ribosomal protein L37E
MHRPEYTACARCGQELNSTDALCPQCGAGANRGQLHELAAEALRLEQISPQAASSVWRQTLDLLPPGSVQFAQIQQRLNALDSGQQPGTPAAPDMDGPRYPVQPPDPAARAVAKTLGSMLLSIAVYYFVLFRNWPVAIGFVVLMLIHEMGHAIALWYYKLSASPPIFVPFLGALINLREPPPNAWIESVVGMGGPLLGTIGAMVCYVIAIALPAHPMLQAELLVAAQLAFILNLFNLLPVPPLDGGRITAAITPWLWVLGLAGLGWIGISEFRAAGLFGLFIPVLILVYALPRIRQTLRARRMNLPYFQVTRAQSWTMGAIYVGLGLLLFGMFHHLGGYGFLRQFGG